MAKYLLKDELHTNLVLINDLLTRHIRVHEAIFNPPLRAKIPLPGIFKKINFEELYEEESVLQELLNERYLFWNEIAATGNDNDRELIQKMKDYTICFIASTSKLTEIAYELNLKAKAEAKLSYSEYNRLVSEYQDNEKQRLKRSSSMNEIVTLLKTS